MNLRPTLDRVHIRRDETPGMSGRLHIPEGAREELTTGTVIAVGPECDILAPGDRIIFGKYAGDIISENELIVGVDEILAIMED